MVMFGFLLMAAYFVLGVWFLWEVYQISLGWFLYFFGAALLLLLFLAPIIGNALAVLVVFGIGAIFVKDHWHVMQKPVSWIFGVWIAELVLTLISV